MQEPTAEQKVWLESQLSADASTFEAQHHNKPSSRWMQERRRQLEYMLVPTSEIIKRMLKIGHPDAIHNRASEKTEFESLAAEIDRRVPNPYSSK